MKTPTMSHAHYVLIAATLADAAAHEPQGAEFAEGWHAAIAALRGRFCDVLKGTNPRFDAARFEAAAKGTPSTGRDRVRS